jgi:hypothetical protein
MKVEKLIARFLTFPSDFIFRELKKQLKYFGFVSKIGGGPFVLTVSNTTAGANLQQRDNLGIAHHICRQ